MSLIHSTRIHGVHFKINPTQMIWTGSAPSGLLFLILTLFLCLNSVGAAIELEQGTDRYSLDADSAYLIDSEGALVIDDLIQSSSDTFTKMTEGQFNFGFREDVFWFRTELVNVSHPEYNWVLYFDYSLLDFIELYEIRDGQVELVQSGGDRLDFESRGQMDHRLNFNLQLAQGESRVLFIRIESESSMQVPMELLTRSELAQRKYRSQFAFGLLYGVIIALILYNLLLYVSTRETAFLFYILYVTLFGLFQMSLNGFTFQYLWPESPAMANTGLLLLMSTSMMAMLQFARIFLNLKRVSSRCNQLMLAMIAIMLLFVVAAFFIDYRPLIQLQTLFVFVNNVVIAGCGIIAWRKGYRPARYLLLAMALVFLGTMLYASVSLGLLPKVFVTEFSIQIGLAGEMILLSLGLADRLNQLKEENLALFREGQITLERRVAERTEELGSAMRKLSEVNKVLEEISMRDGLTQLYNRRHLDEKLGEFWKTCEGRKQPLALIILDLDHFKTINDQHGHLAGDECLISIARLLETQCREIKCIIARFGGEEICVLLPNYRIQEAVNLAEKLRMKIDKTPVLTDGQRISVTASFGVAAIMPEPDTDATTLVRSADEAMYRAKKDGRNCTQS